MTAEMATSPGAAEIDGILNGDENLKIKCPTCGWEARNSAILEAHVAQEHEHEVPVCEQRCNACNKRFTTNDELEVHLTAEHEDEADCSECNAFFKKESDVYQHSNVCHGIIELNTCEKCEKNVISKVALKKHIPSCKGKKPMPPCRNGSSCKYFKSNRCLFVHNEQSRMYVNQQAENGWTIVQPRQRQAKINCNNCKKIFQNQRDLQNHNCQNNQSRSQPPQNQRNNIECR